MTKCIQKKEKKKQKNSSEIRRFQSNLMMKPQLPLLHCRDQNNGTIYNIK